MIYYIVLSFALLFMLTEVQGLNEACTNNSDCDTKNAICINGECNCDALSYNNNTLCLPYATEYNALCYEAKQCEEWMGTNADCKNNRCVCKSKHRWYKGKCLPYFDKGEACESDDDCYNGYDLLSLSCTKGKCVCNSDYYDRGFDCRKKSSLLGDCALNSDCQPFLNMELDCALGKCGLKKNTTNRELHIEELFKEKIQLTPTVSTNIPENASCVKDDDCKDMANSICDVTKGACSCIEETHYFYNGNCVPGLKHCSTVDDCPTNNTMCFKNTCICKQGFFMKDKRCIAELGMDDPDVGYKSDSDCPIKPGKLDKSTCYCKSYWFNDDANRNCIKTMIESIQSCLTNEWCDAMGPYSICNSATNMCECSSFAKLNSDFYCEKDGDPAADICLRDNDCSINERCVDEKCDCVDNFVRNEDDVCRPNIGASCEVVPCSHIGNSSCVAKACKCDSNFVGETNTCLKLAEDLQDSCEKQEQCQNLDHTVCMPTGDGEGSKCACAEEYTAINSTCYQTKKYGDPCMTAADCTRVLNRSYQCRNSLCQCAVGYELKNGYCISSANAVFASYALLLIIVIKMGIS